MTSETSLGGGDGDERGLPRSQGLEAICFTSCVALTMSYPHSVPPFPKLSNEDNAVSPS